MFYSLAVVLGIATVWILSVIWAYFILLAVPQTEGPYNLREFFYLEHNFLVHTLMEKLRLFL